VKDVFILIKDLYGSSCFSGLQGRSVDIERTGLSGIVLYNKIWRSAGLELLWGWMLRE